MRMYREEYFGDDSIKNFRLARARAYRNFEMKDLAKKSGITLPYYAAIEGMRLYPPDDIKQKISDVLKEKADYLFPERFRLYCLEHYREITRTSEDVLDKLNRVKFNARAFKKTLDNEDYQQLIENEDREEYIKNLLNNLGLPAIKREIFYLRFGFENRKFHTLEESGKMFHVTKQRSKQIEQEVIEELKHKVRLKELAELL